MLATGSVSVSLCLSGTEEASTDGRELATQHCPDFLVPPASGAWLPALSIPGPLLPHQEDGSDKSGEEGGGVQKDDH